MSISEIISPVFWNIALASGGIFCIISGSRPQFGLYSFSHFERESCISPPMREVHQTSSPVQQEALLSMLSNRSGFEVAGLFPRLKADTLLEAEFRRTTFGPRLRVPRVPVDEM